jgi:hypothetical protein
MGSRYKYHRQLHSLLHATLANILKVKNITYRLLVGQLIFTSRRSEDKLGFKIVLSSSCSSGLCLRGRRRESNGQQL